MSLGVAQMDSIDCGAVSTEQELRLFGPDELIVVLAAEWHYSRQDPYAVKVSLDTGLDEPVEWSFSRELLAAALLAPEGVGDVRAWPSAKSAAPAEDGAVPGEKVLNIVLGPPGGYARFEAGAAGIEAFLARTQELVPPGEESAWLNLDAELAEFFSQA
ncbi:MAG TPA: SsgA family sporulation/cell division regulator [Trebonia sp.]|nr:SsgA family sporulation/cell division regulator [Trebonia sp.]